MLTIATPFVDKPYSLPLWLENFKKLRVPKAKTKLVWIDMTDNSSLSEILTKYLKEHRHEWRKVEYLRNPPKQFKTVLDHAAARERNQTIAETMNLINELREGHLLLWEDDILVPAHAFERLYSVLEKNPDHVATTGVQYRRNYRNPHQMLLWKFFPWRKNVGLWPDHIEHVKIVNYLNHEEKSEGTSAVDASATGFMLFRDSFVSRYRFREAVFFDGFCAGHDIMLGFDINRLAEGFIPVHNKLVLCWDLKFPHLGTDEHGALKVFRSALCPSPENLNEHHP